MSEWHGRIFGFREEGLSYLRQLTYPIIAKLNSKTIKLSASGPFELREIAAFIGSMLSEVGAKPKSHGLLLWW
jgi:hypothetical protein